jgi:hypothetical protein
VTKITFGTIVRKHPAPIRCYPRSVSMAFRAAWLRTRAAIAREKRKFWRGHRHA